MENLIRTGNIKELKKRIESGLNLNENDSCGMNPLHIACMYNNAEIVELFLNNEANLNSLNYAEWQPIHIAVSYGVNEVIDVLIRYGADLNAGKCRPVSLAIINHHYDTLDKLIKSGANINSNSLDGYPPLHDAVYYNSVQAIELLLKNGANVNFQAKFGNTALHIAGTNIDIIRKILEYKPDILIKNKWEETPIDRAEKMEYLAIARLLRNILLQNNLAGIIYRCLCFDVQEHKDAKFREFLYEGVYDPRLLILISTF